MLKVVDIECIRKLYFREGWPIRKIARELGHSRKTVRKALSDAGPWTYRLTQPRPSPKAGPYRDLIRQWLEEDRRAPRKQRHTARRVYERLRDEYGYDGAESTIRRVVAELRRELEMNPVEPYFVLSSQPGEMAQVDWGQAQVELAGVPTVVHLFCMRLHYSGVAFVWASLHQKLEAFLEGHVRAFAWLGGVPEKVVYDNLSPVVRKILQGHEERELSERFIALRSHYVFDSVFANPAAAHEKGGVENHIGYIRRNVLTPVPKVASMDELNGLLLGRCEQDRQRRLGRWDEERKALRPIPPGTFKPCVVQYLPVNKLSLVTYERNRYSVPTRYIGQVLRTEVYADRLELYCREEQVAVHRRALGRGHTELRLEHYLSALARKPYAVTHAAVVRQLPEPYQTLRRHLLESDPSGYRQMVHVLLQHQEFTTDEVRQAVQEAVAAGICQADEIRQLLLNRRDRNDIAQGPPRGPVVPVGDPRRYDALLEVSA
ncbi:MAG: IS21 family transposase [Firmicutes bacterium]|nr:IS21 family transposase [Bacillota bacterium]